MSAFVSFIASALVSVALVLSAAIIAAAICRIRVIVPRKGHKTAWGMLYIVYAAAAVAVQLDVLEALVRFDVRTAAEQITLGEWLALIGLALNIVLTRKRWGDGVPAVVLKGIA